MVIFLMKKDTPVCKLSLGCLSLSGIYIYDYEIMNRKSFPFQINENTDIKESLIKWFDKRIKPNSDPDLDQTMLELYQLDPVHYGRMYWYQYLGAFMSYMTSSKDDYWVNPAYPQVLSYALVDPYFIQGYIYEPAADYNHCMETNREFEKCLKYPYKIR